MRYYIKQFARFWVIVIRRFFEDECNLRAAGLVFTTLLSLVPLMVVSLSVLSAFPVFKGVSEQLQHFVFEHFVAESAQVVQNHLAQFVQQAKHLPITGSVFLVITALVMVFNMEETFNAIWHVNKRRHGLQAFFAYWTLLTLGPLLFGLGFLFASYLVSFPAIAKVMDWGHGYVARFILPAVLSLIGFMFFYMALPNCRVLFRHAALGGVVATVLFELVKYLFVLYFVYFPTYQLLYGTLAAVPIFLMWIYVSWWVILFGGVVSYVSTNWKDS